jgi:hypothetical protein
MIKKRRKMKITAIRHGPFSPVRVFLKVPDYAEFSKWIEISNRKGGGCQIFYGCHSPSVSPDRTKVAYIKTKNVTHLGYLVTRSDEIVVRDLQTNKETSYEVGRAINLTSQAWSPDGSKIVFTAEGKNNIGILKLKKGSGLLK